MNTDKHGYGEKGKFVLEGGQHQTVGALVIQISAFRSRSHPCLSVFIRGLNELFRLRASLTSFPFGLAALMTLFCVNLVAAAPAGGSKANDSVADFALLDQQGHFQHLYYYAKDPQTRAIVLFVQGDGCPLVRKRVPELKRLRDAYAAKGVIFWMINANQQDSRDEVVKEAAEFGIDLPILLDETQLVAKALKITRTGEAIVIEPNSWRIRYRGALDDGLSYEAQKTQVQHAYLQESLDAMLAGEDVKTTITPAPGCAITFAEMKVSYTETIAPLLKAKCVQCHTKGGIGPFAMANYEKVQGWSDMIREVLMTRRMPPWQADPHVGKFCDDLSLSAGQTRLLVQWIDAGLPRGEGADPLVGYQPELPEWKLGKPDYVINIPEQSVAAEGVFDYRYITVEAPNKEDVWLRAVEIVPGNTHVLHHIIATTIMPGEDRNKHQKGLAGYAPGMGPDLLPTGTGRLLKAGCSIVFQLHYTASGKAEMDRSRLGLYVSKQPPEQELQGAVLIDSEFTVPPNARESVTSKTYRFKRDALLYTMNPHMHLRGKWMRYTAHYPDGTTELLLNVPNYRFDWQRNYNFQSPKRMPKGTELVVEAAWDNSPLNLNNPDASATVGWGEQTFNEMFFASFRFTYPGAKLSSAKTVGNTASELN